MSKQRKAFTLVELLVVIAIIGILFVVLISKVDFATEKSKATGVQTDFRSYQVAIETVARENAGLSVLVDADATGAEKYAELEKALNKNLDPKLHVEIDADGKISTEAKDPWKEQYLGAYLAPDEDGTVKDRGAIVIYSKGSNLKLGTTAATENGIVNVTLESGKETEGADDYSISTIYTYINGYGEIQASTSGFSNNQGDTVGNGNNVTPSVPGGSDPSDPADPDQGGNGGNNQTPDPSDPDGTTETPIMGYNQPLTLKKKISDDDFLSVYNACVEQYGNQIVLASNNEFQLGLVVAVEQNAFAIIYMTSNAGYIYANNNLLAQGFLNLPSDSAWYDHNNILVPKNTNLSIIFTPDTSLGVANLYDLAPLFFDKCEEHNFNKKSGIVHTIGNCSTRSLYYYACSKCGALSEQTYAGDYHHIFDQSVIADAFLCDNISSCHKDYYYSCVCGAIGSETFCSFTHDYQNGSCSICAESGGLFDADGTMIADWSTLTDVYGMDIEKDYSVSTYDTDTTSPYYVLKSNPELADGVKIKISDTVTKVGQYAFYGCTQLTSLDLGSGVTIIGDRAFDGCSNLTGALVIPDSVVSIGNYAFYCGYGLTALDLGSGVTNVGIYAFYDCTRLTGTLIIPDSVTNIGNYAFSGCKGLTGELVIPDSVTSIGDWAFAHCSGLTGDLVIPDSVTSIGDGVFSGCKGLTGELVIPNGVTSIGTSAFGNCKGLTGELVIPDSVISIGEWAFQNCSKLTSLDLGNGVTGIGGGAFDGCSGLTGTLIIPGGVTSIGNYAFRTCSGLTSVIIPDSVTNIGGYAFVDCYNLTSISMLSTEPPVAGADVFRSCFYLTSIYVPDESVDAYKAADGWSAYADLIKPISERPTE